MKKRIMTFTMAIILSFCMISILPITAIAAMRLTMPDENIIIPDVLDSATIVLPGSDIEMKITNVLITAKLKGSEPDDDSPSLQLITVGTSNLTFSKDIECQKFGEDYSFDAGGISQR